MLRKHFLKKIYLKKNISQRFLIVNKKGSVNQFGFQ
jgi:hypothetical protein